MIGEKVEEGLNFGNASKRDEGDQGTKFPQIAQSSQKQYSKGILGSNRTRFKSQYSKQENEGESLQNVWIIKPGENTNRGNGISVCSTFKEIKDIFSANDFDEYQARTFIVQKYIENP